MKLAWLIEKLDKPSKHVDGEITLRDQTNVWKIHLVHGQIFYITGGVHPVRRWNRALKQHCANWNWQVEFSQLSNKQYWECQLLHQGIIQNQISLVRAKLVIRSVTQECLFELSGHTELESDWQMSQSEPWASCRSIALSSWEMQTILSRTMAMRQEWQASGLAHLSPTLTPVLQQNSYSHQSIPVPNQYLNGEFTLWDIALQLEKSVVEVSHSLLPWTENHVLRFEPISDLTLSIAKQSLAGQPIAAAPISPQSNVQSVEFTRNQRVDASAATHMLPKIQSTPSPHASPHYRPLIACIDDSPVLAHTLKKILLSAGYQMLSIQEPMRGFAQLIEHKPDLILLDLLLPNADGYSICKFLRDTPVFKKTPIIILTGQNTSIDRARAMLAGATGFLSKPPQAEELLQMIQKHLEAV